MRAEEVAGLDELPSLPLNMATSLARSHCSKSPRSESIVPGADVTSRYWFTRVRVKQR